MTGQSLFESSHSQSVFFPCTRIFQYPSSILVLFIIFRLFIIIRRLYIYIKFEYTRTSPVRYLNKFSPLPHHRSDQKFNFAQNTKVLPRPPFINNISDPKYLSIYISTYFTSFRHKSYIKLNVTKITNLNYPHP